MLNAQKFFLSEAKKDNIVVTDSELESQLNNRISYFINLYGSKEKLEQMSGKTIEQIKEENRYAIKEQMLGEVVQSGILKNVKITPAEVKAFYKKIPADSLPFFPATVQVGQIVIDPRITRKMDDRALTKLESIRKEIVTDGKSFETMAGLYSDDPGSRNNGGRYDGVTRFGPWVPEFVAAVFKLQNGEISPAIKTKFGYHIIQMIRRKGDEADIRHILIKPELTSVDFQTALVTLDSIRNVLVSGKMSFKQAVNKFSTDEVTKRTGGMIADPNTGNTELDISKLNTEMLVSLCSLNTRQYSRSQIFINDANIKSCRILYLKSRKMPHEANLKDDYDRIAEVALAQKKQLKLQKWLKAKTKK